MLLDLSAQPEQRKTALTFTASMSAVANKNLTFSLRETQGTGEYAGARSAGPRPRHASSCRLVRRQRPIGPSLWLGLSARVSAQPDKRKTALIFTASMSAVLNKSLTMTYSHMGRPHTTIGAESFHC